MLYRSMQVRMQVKLFDAEKYQRNSSQKGQEKKRTRHKDIQKKYIWVGNTKAEQRDENKKCKQ